MIGYEESCFVMIVNWSMSGDNHILLQFKYFFKIVTRALLLP